MPDLVRDFGFTEEQRQESMIDVHNSVCLPISGGETHALDRLRYFLSGPIYSYKETRPGLCGLDFSSKLSPWLANGCLSARRIYHEVIALAMQNESTEHLVFQLRVRDFFHFYC